MTLPSVTDANYPTTTELRDGILRTIVFAFARRGLVANVLPGSDHFIRATGFASRVAIAIANNALALADFNPLTATGTSLEILAGVFGVPKRPAGPGGGAVSIVCIGLVSIPAGYQLTAPTGKKYTVAGLYTAIATGSVVDIIATTGGADTNLETGTILTWDSAAIGALNSKATVVAPGIIDGADEDTDDVLRKRLIEHLTTAPGGGNPAHIIEVAEASSASIEHAYTYSALRGPGSCDVAATAAGGTRTISAANVAGMRTAVTSKIPGNTDYNVTTSAPEGVDVVLSAALPFPQSGGGSGTGWRDGTPWPAPGETVKVTAFSTISQEATTDATTGPTVGASIGVWDAEAAVMREYTISEVTGTTFAWVIKVQNDWLANPASAYISAGAVSLVAYAAAFYKTMLTLGPGEKTVMPELLPRSRRFPSTDVFGPSALTSLQTANVQRQFAEITDLNYDKRLATGDVTDLFAASIPLTTADPPNVLVLKHFAIRPK